MADANRLAAALRYQQDMEGPVTMNPNIAEQGRKGRANMAPPTSVMDPRSRDYERRSKETENFLIGADILAGALPFAPLAKGAAMAAGRYAGPKIAQGLEQHLVNTGGILPMDVYHGSPYKFDKFDMSKIGTGEGAQAYGHGLYLAENPVVAKEYQKTLSAGRAPNVVDAKLQQLYDQTGNWEAAVDKHLGSVYNTPKVKAQMRETMLKNGPPLNTEGGSLYKVDLPDEQIAKMLDWDKPLSQQSEGVQASLKSILGNSYKPTMTGQQAYEMASYKTMPMIMKEDGAYAQSHLRQPSASNSLRELGIPGIRYLDQGSRAGGAGTSNFVVFDPAHMNIIGRE